MSELKKKLNLSDRKALTSKILDKYPEKCPVFLSIDNKPNSIHLSRYIVTYNLTMLQFLVIVRKKINIGAEESLTLFIEVFNNNKIIETILVPMSDTIGEIYKKHKDQDNFLYLRLVKENTFGSI